MRSLARYVRTCCRANKNTHTPEVCQRVSVCGIHKATGDRARRICAFAPRSKLKRQKQSDFIKAFEILKRIQSACGRVFAYVCGCVCVCRLLCGICDNLFPLSSAPTPPQSRARLKRTSLVGDVCCCCRFCLSVCLSLSLCVSLFVVLVCVFVAYGASLLPSCYFIRLLSLEPSFISFCLLSVRA